MPPTKILVVEDEQLVANDLREMLEHLGYQVPRLVASGEEAVELVTAVCPELVLMDIRLKGEMDGVSAAEQIQSRCQVPIVYLTANTDPYTLDRVKATHPFGYILKPFDEVSLSTTIEIALARYQGQQQIQRALLECEQSKRTVEQQNEFRAQFMSMATHEFRNPLVAIRFATEILQRYGNQLPLEKQQRHLQRIQAAVDTLRLLLEDMLVLEQTGYLRLQFAPEAIDLVLFCQEQIELFQATTEPKFQFIFSTQAQSCVANGDPRLLWHLLNNLLSNAVKYSPNGGAIVLTLDCSDNTAVLQVQDQGIGIPPEAQAKLFEPFYRAANVGSIPGTGLGLAIVKQCLDRHGGQIAISSTPAQGTTFTVTLPRNHAIDLAEPLVPV